MQIGADAGDVRAACVHCFLHRTTAEFRSAAAVAEDTTVDKYVSRLRTNLHGGYVEMVLLANACNLRVGVYTFREGILCHLQNVSPDACHGAPLHTVRLLWRHGHYDALVPA